MRALAFGTHEIDTYLKVLKEAERLNRFSEAKEALVHNVVSGSYSGTIGEAPPALVRKKEVLEEMKEQCPSGQIRSLVDALIEDMSNTIKSHLNEAAELLDPKD